MEIRSDEVQEILGAPPGWLVRWGTAVVLGCIGVLLFLAWFVRYPEVVSGRVLLTTDQPPMEVIASVNGYVATLSVSDRDTVSAGQLLAVIQSTANYDHIVLIDSLASVWALGGLDSLRKLSPTRSLSLGEVQSTYTEFLRDLDLYQFGAQNRNTATLGGINTSYIQINRLREDIKVLEKSRVRVVEILQNADASYQKQQKLVQEGALARMELEKERVRIADLERQLDQLDDDISRKKNEALNIQKSISEAGANQAENVNTNESRLLTSLDNLRSSIVKWNETHLLKAPGSGLVSMNSEVYSARQYVRAGEVVMTIVPQKTGRIIGRMQLDAQASVKVVEMKKVILRLDAYPYPEYGTVEGIVLSKSLTPKDNKYLVLITVPSSEGKMKSSAGKLIPFAQQLQGNAEIVTQDKSFLERIGEQIFAGS
ncbi:MAG: HlyD family efflux transporter periplasmic adaptor subunit [Chitinophagales bacterium]|nr:HlyD family efflux transporter periplasmic adaptor subunit [Chitinophagales bacterium]